MDETLPKQTRVFRLRRKPEAPAVEETARGEDFDTLFLQHWPHVYNLLASLTGSPDEAEDLALEAFLRLHDRLPSFSTDDNPGGWLRRVALRLGLDALRRVRRRARYEVEAGQYDLEQQASESPAELLARKEARQAVRRVLAEMKPRSAQLLVLRYSGLPYQEMAAVLGVAPTSIGPLLLRAEKEFKQRYRAAGEEEEA